MAEKGTPLDVLPVKLITQVLRFCDWQTRAAVMQLNRSFVENFAPGNSAFWRAMCCWLSVEDAVYVPRISHSRDWRTTFVVYYPARSLWKGPPVQESAQFSISVVARFKPKASDGELKVAAAHVPKVVLPLHQRLQMLMARYKCSASDARRMMWAKDRRASSVSAGSNAEMEKENINGQQLSLPTDLDGQPAFGPIAYAAHFVAALYPPVWAAGAVDVASLFFCSHEGTPIGVVSMCDRKVLICAPGVGLREFGFGRVYSQNNSQRDIFDEAARPLL